MGRSILVTGALGQIGSELIPVLRERYGADAVIGSDIRMPPAGSALGDGPFEHLDCTQPQQMRDIVAAHDVGTIYHLAALLSAVAEEKPQTAWHLNMDSLYHVLEIARRQGCAVFFPSSIGAFGPSTPRDDAPQETIQRPTTMYGVTKVAAELLCDYYFRRFGVDVRSLRLPGLISYSAPPGGGTTDYAVEIFYQAVRYSHYTCFLAPETRLEMMYMPDAIRGIVELMAAPGDDLEHRNAYNFSAMDFTPEELAAEIGKHVSGFAIDYDVDPVRQEIADSWPRTIDDGAARAEWGWKPDYDLERMTAEMIDVLGARLRRAPSA
jgi:nucleoside-diphosphate-sugar epimerase